MHISVIIPAYNCEKFISESLDSVLQDLEEEDEILICNDCSTDSTLDQIMQFTDKRIKVFSNDINKGISYSLNRLMNIAKNEIISRMDADDIWEMGRRNKVVYFYSKPNHSRFILFGSYFVFNSEKIVSMLSSMKQTNSTFFLFSLFLNGDYLHPTLNMLKNELVNYRYNEALSGVEDIDLYMRLIGDGFTLKKSEDIFLRYRRGSNFKNPKSLYSVQLKLVKAIFKRSDFINGLVLGIVFSAVFLFKSAGLYKYDRKFNQ